LATVKHELDLLFKKELVVRGVISEMSRAHDVVFSVYRASVSHQQGKMIVFLIGEETAVEAAEKFIRGSGVEAKLNEALPYTDEIPHLPRQDFPESSEPDIQRKLWLTINVGLIERPVLWEMSRRFNVHFDIRQTCIGNEVGIIGLLVRGPVDQVNAACEFLESVGAEIEPIEKSVVEG
jgi:hypothetical protein